jgi:hypothetical protein
MRFFWPVACRASSRAGAECDPYGSSHLPKVTHPECGHEVWWDGGALPYEPPAGSPVHDYLSRGRELGSISPGEWMHLRSMIVTELTAAGHGVPWIYPGMRVGPLSMHLTDGGPLPDLLKCGAYLLYSERLVRAFETAGLQGYEACPTRVTVDGNESADSMMSYYEVVTGEEVRLASSANAVVERCDVCGSILGMTYDRLAIDESSWSGADFVRPEGTFLVVLSERAARLIEKFDSGNVVLIPSERLAVGQNAPDLTAIVAEIEFDQQMKRRR